jgi:hypothetical protein
MQLHARAFECMLKTRMHALEIRRQLNFIFKWSSCLYTKIQRSACKSFGHIVVVVLLTNELIRAQNNCITHDSTTYDSSEHTVVHCR